MKILKKTVPERTCIACHGIKSKKELTRLVRTPGGVIIDPTGKKAGRGAYLCRDIKCWEIGVKGNRIEHALGVTLSAENREELTRYAMGLVPEERIA
jgi:uncharacterized protein